MVKIPCNFNGDAYTGPGRHIENGTFMIYGDIPIPPETIVCPKCKGTGFIEVRKSVVEKEIEELIEERNEINMEIRKWRRYLK